MKNGALIFLLQLIIAINQNCNKLRFFNVKKSIRILCKSTGGITIKISYKIESILAIVWIHPRFSVSDTFPTTVLSMPQFSANPRAILYFSPVRRKSCTLRTFAVESCQNIRNDIKVTFRVFWIIFFSK